MKQIKKWVSLCLCLALLSLFPAPLLATQQGLGGYEEAILTMPEGYERIVGPAVAPDGSFAIAALETESGAWKLLRWRDVASEPEILPLAFDGGMLSGIDYAPDGRLLGYCDGFAYEAYEPREEEPQESEAAPSDGADPEAEDPLTQEFDFNPEDYSTHFFWFAQDGSLEGRFEVTGMMSLVRALPDGQVAAYEQMGGQLFLYDGQGKALASLPTDYPYALAATEETLFVFTMEGVERYALPGLEKAGTLPFAVAYGTLAAFGPDGALYTLGSGGLQRLDPETGEAETLGAFVGTLAGDPTNLLTGFGLLADGTVLCRVIEGAGSTYGVHYVDDAVGGTLATYTYNPQLDLGSRPEFRIVALRDHTLLRKAVGDFQRRHPELNVVLETLLSDGAEATLEDGIRTLNTMLLAGQGGDVMVLDELPLETYVRKGLLMDMAGRLEDLGVLPGILSGSHSAGGGLYAIPTRFSLDSLWGNAGLLEGVQSLSDLSELPLDPDQSLLSPRTPKQWLSLFYPASEAAFRDEQGALHFDSPAFTGFLETLYALYARQTARGEEGEAQGVSVARDMQDVMNGASALYPASFSSLINTAVSYSVSGGEEGGFVPVPAIDGEGVCYTPSQILGIGQGTQHPEEALEFVRMMLGENLQALENDDGLPVTEKALDAQIASYERLRDEGGVIMVATEEGNPVMVKQPQSHTWEAVRALCMAVSRPYTPDPTLADFIAEETEAFFAGQISAEQAAQALAQRAWSYLNE